MMDKKSSRLRRALRARVKMRELGAIRLSIHRTPRHIYAQVIAADGDKVLASASTVEKELRGDATGNVEAAKVAFDRSGFKYHGRVKALADAAREGGLEF